MVEPLSEEDDPPGYETVTDFEEGLPFQLTDQDRLNELVVPLLERLMETVGPAMA